MLGDAADPEADLQQRVRLCMVWLLVLAMVTGSSKKGGLLQSKWWHLSGVGLQHAAEPARHGRRICAAEDPSSACGNSFLMYEYELLEGWSESACGIMCLRFAGTPSRCICLWKRASLRTGRL